MKKNRYITAYLQNCFAYIQNSDVIKYTPQWKETNLKRNEHISDDDR